MAPIIPPEIAFDIQNIHTALNYPVPDQETLVNTIGRREYQQLVAIARQYKATYHVDLPAELDRRILGSVGSLLSAVCMNKVLAEVQYVHRAGKSSRKFELLRKKDTALEVFCQILVGRTPEELRELNEAYTAVHQSDMLEHVHSFCKDDLTKAFFTDILKDKEQTPIEGEALTIETEKLKAMLEGHDLVALLQYVSSLTTAQLKTVVRTYNSVHKDAHVVTTFEKKVVPAHKHSHDHTHLVLFAVMQAADPSRHISLLFEEAMHGLGTNEDQLNRLVALHRGKFMEKVKSAYHIDYSRTLADRVRGDTSGIYSNLICHLINQTI
ncbi:hypothetical protein B0O80DRAFT_448950 [Mortierella sp. GBAus27b]|nr:hypothetical protein BGX31_009209 [Mortierella sp. GBA43]KAI8355295.1 hypothetical protein B0O80DRAFT_448950 [Mortierella sp. GBAus27b]